MGCFSVLDMAFYRFLKSGGRTRTRRLPLLKGFRQPALPSGAPKPKISAEDVPKAVQMLNGSASDALRVQGLELREGFGA